MYKRLLTVCALAFLLGCTKSALTIKKFPFHLSNDWYQLSPQDLHVQTNELLESADNFLSEKVPYSDAQPIHALVVPHAAYSYSGPIAAIGYRRIPNPERYDRVILLAPSHNSTLSGVATLSAESYTTPLGTQKLDTSVIQRLLKQSWCVENNSLFNNEHSIEIQIPLIQRTLPRAHLVPLLVGTLSDGEEYRIAETLKSLITPTTLVVVSSDFTHYGKAFHYLPFTTDIEQNIEYLDSEAITTLGNGSVAEWKAFIKRTGATICGKNPLTILLALEEINTWGHTTLETIAYDTSGQQTSDFSHSVSYVALSIRSLALSKNEKEYLLACARKSLSYAVVNPTKHMPAPSPEFGILQQPLGLFATLYEISEEKKQLRGCIGTLSTTKPLYKTLHEMITSAALHDTRFVSVTPFELPFITIELSLLTTPQPIASYTDIKLGTHGIVLQHGSRKAVFLPHVPTQQQWNLTTTLGELSKKAGLPAHAWQDPAAQFSVFEAIVFSEKEIMMNFSVGS